MDPFLALLGPAGAATSIARQLAPGAINFLGEAANGLTHNDLNGHIMGVSDSKSGANSGAAYDQSINNTQSAIDRLGGQLNSGNSSIDASYQNALNQLLLGKNQAQQSYDTNKKQTAQNFVGAKNTIGSQAGQTLSGLQRLLGSRGAGGGSAYNIAAPGAVTRQATLQRTDATNTFGQNNQALDTNWGNYITGYNNEVNGATSQRDLQKQDLNRSIEQNRAQLLQSLAGLQAEKAQAAGGNGVAQSQPYLDQANAILNGISNYTTAPISYQTQAYTAPNLSAYTSTPVTPTYQGQAAGSDYYSPYLAALLGKKQQTA